MIVEVLCWKREFVNHDSKKFSNREAVINILIYITGDNVLQSFTLSEEEKKKYNVVKQKLNGYFVKRWKVNPRDLTQQANEGSTDAYWIAENCLYKRCDER